MLETLASLLSASGFQALHRHGGESVAALGGIAFEALPRWGGWLFATAVDHVPRLDALLSSLGGLAFETLPRYGGWLGIFF